MPDWMCACRNIARKTCCQNPAKRATFSISAFTVVRHNAIRVGAIKSRAKWQLPKSSRKHRTIPPRCFVSSAATSSCWRSHRHWRGEFRRHLCHGRRGRGCVGPLQSAQRRCSPEQSRTPVVESRPHDVFSLPRRAEEVPRTDRFASQSLFECRAIRAMIEDG